jgi:Uma2 family endonuclease
MRRPISTPPNNSFDRSAVSWISIRGAWMLGSILPRSGQFGRYVAISGVHGYSYERKWIDLYRKDIAMSSLPSYYLSPEEYLVIERQAEYKSEYVDGVLYAMAGGSERHNLIAANTIISIGVQLRNRPCRVYPSDLKVRVPNSKRFFYPDVSVVCGEISFADDEKDVILNPILIVEVLSESTAAYDRGKKFLSYQQIDALQEYLLISQDEVIVEHYVRQNNDTWLYRKAVGLEETILLPSIECEVTLKDIYDKAT